MIEFMFLKALMLIKQVNQKKCENVTIGIFQIKALDAIDAMI